MKIIDITRELFSSPVYPGDPSPKLEQLRSMSDGGLYNLSSIHICNHNGTHIDAPLHFINGGSDVTEIPLSHCFGRAYVTEHSGYIGKKEALSILESAKMADIESCKRILIKGAGILTDEGATAFMESGVLLVGSECGAVGDENAPMSVHRILLKAGVVLLERICLDDVPVGVWTLCALPLFMKGAEGSPVRAVLVSDE